jgi:hypothetical protein
MTEPGKKIQKSIVKIMHLFILMCCKELPVIIHNGSAHSRETSSIYKTNVLNYRIKQFIKIPEIGSKTYFFKTFKIPDHALMYICSCFVSFSKLFFQGSLLSD